MRLLDYRGLAALDAVISHGSFDKAAAALSISQPAVSQRIRALEEASGTLLVIRSQPTVATPFGQRLIAHFRQVRLLEAALDETPGDVPSPPELAIAVNADSAATWIPEALAPLLSAPACLVDIRIDDQDNTLPQLREGRVFACVTSSSESVAGTTMTPLGIMRYHCVASPAFARRWFGSGFEAGAVEHAPALVFGADDTLHQRFLMQQFGAPPLFPHHRFPTSEGFVRFIENGFAYGMVPLLQCRDSLATGALIDVAPGAWLDVALMWHAWSIQTALTRALSKQVVDTASTWLI